MSEIYKKASELRISDTFFVIYSSSLEIQEKIVKSVSQIDDNTIEIVGQSSRDAYHFGLNASTGKQKGYDSYKCFSDIRCAFTEQRNNAEKNIEYCKSAIAAAQKKLETAIEEEREILNNQRLRS